MPKNLIGAFLASIPEVTSSEEGTGFKSWGYKSIKKNATGPFVLLYPAKLEAQVSLLKHIFVAPSKKFLPDQKGVIHISPSENIMIKFKISKVTVQDETQINQASGKQHTGSWMHLTVTAKAMAAPGPCKMGLIHALEKANFEVKLDFIKAARFKSGSDVLHVKIKQIPEVFDYSKPLFYYIRSPEGEFVSHKAEISRIAPGLMKELTLKPCKHLLSARCLCHVSERGNTTRKGPPGGPRALDTPADFLAAQRAMQRNAMEQQPNEPEQQPSEDLC